MSIPISQISLSCIIPTLILLIPYIVSPVNGFESRKLDEKGVQGSSDPSVKCGGCSPCGHPSCYSSPPPPSLPPPPPPSPPPPKKTPPTTPYCPPPPSSSGYVPPSGSGFVYITGPPGDLYPVQNSSSSTWNLAALTKISFGLGLLGFFVA